MSKARFEHIGSCLCGSTRFSFLTPVKWCLHCHCESCRLNTGSPFTTFFGVSDGRWAFDGDAPGEFVSSPGVTRSFCKTCGTPMAFRAEKFPDEIHFYLAHLKDQSIISPTGHVHWAERKDWVTIHDKLPKFQATSLEAPISE